MGIYPGCLLSFPRADDDALDNKYETVRTQIENKEIRYSAQFNGSEALRLMPTIPPKMVDKEKAIIRDTFAMEVEAECDRQMLCEKIVQRIDQAVNAQALSQDLLATGESTMGPPPSVSPKVAEGTKDRRGNKSNEPDQTSAMREST